MHAINVSNNRSTDISTRNDTNVSNSAANGVDSASNDNGDDDGDPMNAVTSSNGSVNDSAEKEGDLVSYNSGDGVGSTMDVGETTNGSDNVDFSMDIVTPLLDGPILANLDLQPALVSSKIKISKPIPSLIRICDLPMFQPAKKPTQTAKYISNFISDFEKKNQYTASPVSITMNQNFSFYSDENFGHLHYSDSE